MSLRPLSHPDLPHADDLVQRLTDRLGRDHVVTAPDDLALHLREERGLYQGCALALVRPADTAEVAFVVGECDRAGVPVVAHGGNTGLVGGGVPYGGINLSGSGGGVNSAETLYDYFRGLSVVRPLA